MSETVDFVACYDLRSGVVRLVRANEVTRSVGASGPYNYQRDYDALVERFVVPEDREQAMKDIRRVFQYHGAEHKTIHGALELKEEVKKVLAEFKDIEVRDVGTFTTDSVDYPDIAEKVCGDVTSGAADRGIVLCGTGIGISIAANKIKGIRAALCHEFQFWYLLQQAYGRLRSGDFREQGGRGAFWRSVLCQGHYALSAAIVYRRKILCTSKKRRAFYG